MSAPAVTIEVRGVKGAPDCEWCHGSGYVYRLDIGLVSTGKFKHEGYFHPVRGPQIRTEPEKRMQQLEPSYKVGCTCTNFAGRRGIDGPGFVPRYETTPDDTPRHR